jgi:hypothetical protein
MNLTICIANTIISGRHILFIDRNGEDKMHTMTLIRKHEGLEEWLCSTCGRHMLVNWYPKFKRTIIQAGDDSAGHSGFKGDVQAMNLENGGGVEINKTEDQHIPVDETSLAPWLNWMAKTDFSDRWNGSVQ